MATTLRRVLQAFEQAPSSMRLDDLSRMLRIDPATLDNMIQYWVHKGRIREVLDTPTACHCQTCYTQAASCPFVLRLPRRYELVPLPTGENRPEALEYSHSH